MKIAYVTSEFVTDNNGGGGQASYIANIASIMAERGHNVFVITKGDEYKSIPWKRGITVIYINCYPDNWFASKIFGRYHISFFMNRALGFLHKKEKFDVIQISNLNGIPLLMSRKLPSVIRISDFSPAWDMALEEHFNLDEVYINSKEMQRLRSFRRAKKIFGPSEVCAKLTSKYSEKNVEVIESPLNICKDIEKPEIFGVLEYKEYFLFFGSLNFLKGLHVVCEIADVFLEENPSKYIVFLGPSGNVPYEGEEIDAKDFINKKIVKHRSRVIVLDPIYEKKYTNYIISKALACVLPSRIDNLPNTCIEAMALGKVVIGTRGASFDQLIDDEINGLLIDVDDAEGLLKKMNYTVNLSKEQLDSMGEKAKETVQRMNGENIYNKHITLYDEVRK